MIRREHLRVQREKEKIEKEEEIRYLHAKKLEEEHIKRQKAEEMIRLLENEEKDLIHRLRRTQQLQQDVSKISNSFFVQLIDLFLFFN